ncbi:hypothetical protein JW766_01855 [Candidatus Dojkabacteria bacterium]|nr:hypothetical protein [Candidatus Dojkabacteria bacterium]
MSKSLIKLIDSALLPAAVMIVGKVVGLIITNIIFNLDWGIATDPNNFFSVRIVYPTVADQITATSYSNLIMYLFVFTGFLFVLVQALYFHSSHITPHMIAKLATNNLLNLISDSFEIYYKASVWLVILWISFFALFINVLMERAYDWIGAVCFISSILATVMLLRDVSSEIQIAKRNLPKVASTSFKASP